MLGHIAIGWCCPGHCSLATGTDRIFANLFWMGVMIWRK